METGEKVRDLMTERANEMEEMHRMIEEAPWRVK
jgi:hypothetical protein